MIRPEPLQLAAHMQHVLLEVEVVDRQGEDLTDP
jgi:uncharacterized protein YnzC (UPF0291/DUF896 family)